MPVVPPPLLALAAALTQRSLARRSPPPSTRRAALATTVASASVALAGAAGRQFQRVGTTVEPFRPREASVLVTTGSNAITRNPMYVGMAGLLVAHATWRRSWTALLPAAAFVVAIDRLQIAAEESALLEKFGADYEAYRAASPRWLGLKSVVTPAGRRSG